MSVKLTLGSFDVPTFNDATVVFGADRHEYPSREVIPEKFWNGRTRFNDAASGLFFNGGKLADYGLKLKKDIDRHHAFRAIQAWLCSFAPQHEHKEATVAWALSEWCEVEPARTEETP